MNIKAIIFDWGRTLFDSEIKKEYHESYEVLKYCKEKGYRIVICSLVGFKFTLEERKEQIENSSLKEFLENFFVTDTDKDIILNEAVEYLKLPRSEILIIDDRIIRAVKYGIKNSHPTVWFQNGKFANELPNEETGNPTHTIHSLLELKNII